MIDILYEYKSSPIYHGTSIKNAYLIVYSNELRGNVSNETETYGVSFTRNKNEAYGSVYIKVDQEKLSYNYKIHPIYRDGIAGRDLAEERVDKTITNIRKYIIEIGLNYDLVVNRIRLSLTEIALSGRNELKESDGEAYDLMMLLKTCDKYNINMSAELRDAGKYIDMFYNNEPDTKYLIKLKNRRK